MFTLQAETRTPLGKTSPQEIQGAFHQKGFIYPCYQQPPSTGPCCVGPHVHYIDVIMTTMASQITRLNVVYSTVYSDADQRKHQSSASLAFVWGIHRDR